MMKCPEKENLSLYVDGELESKELAEVRVHLETCAACRKEAESMAFDTVALREGITSVFAQHRMSDRIMCEIRKSPQIINSETPATSWWQRILLPSLALVLVLIMFVFLYPSAQKFQGSVNSVSFQALNNESAVDGVTALMGQRFQLQSPAKMSLAGRFLVSIVAEQPSEFVLTGKAMVSLADPTQIVFSNAMIELSRYNGKGLQVVVNDKAVPLTVDANCYQSFSSKETVDTKCASFTESIARSAESASITIDVLADDKQQAATGIIASISQNNRIATEVVPVENIEQPASGVDHITNPFVDQPLGAGN